LGGDPPRHLGGYEFAAPGFAAVSPRGFTPRSVLASNFPNFLLLLLALMGGKGLKFFSAQPVT
jgi:hypothetical protein